MTCLKHYADRPSVGYLSKSIPVTKHIQVNRFCQDSWSEVRWPTGANAPQRRKTLPLGETCCSFINDANSETHTRIQNKYNNGNVLQMKKSAARSKNKYINSKHAANTETLPNQKHANSENTCNRKTLQIQS